MIPPVLPVPQCPLEVQIPPPMPKIKPYVFPKDDFFAEFPEFKGLPDFFTEAMVARIGNEAHRFITDWEPGFPLADPEDRRYALFLMTAHMLALRKQAADNLADGTLPAGGRVRKATVGAVTVETDTPSNPNADDYTYWLNQTTYGQELLAFLSNAAPAGIYRNFRPDSVRVL